MASPVSLSSELESRIASRQARIGVIGMGYVGLPLALLFSEQRFRVTGFDVDTTKVEALNSGNSYIVRIPATEIVKRPEHPASRATAPTPRSPRWTSSSSASPLRSTSIISPTSATSRRPPRAIAPHLRQGQLVILESTTYPGTTEEILIPILESGNPAGLRAIAQARRVRLLRRLLARARRPRQ